MNCIGWIILAAYTAIGAAHSASKACYVFKSIRKEHGYRNACEMLLIPGIAVGVFAFLFWPIDIAISIIRDRMYGDKKQ